MLAGTPWGPHWCSRCDKLRLDAIEHQFNAMNDELAASEPPGMPLLQSREGMNPVERLMADASEPPGEPSETGGGPVAPGA